VEDRLPASLDLEDQIVAAIRRIIRAIDLHSQHLREHYGLTAPQIAALREASRLENATIGSLARALHLSQPTVSGIVDRLERQRLVNRISSQKDRRAVAVRVTAEGAKVLRDAPSLLADRFRHDLDRLEQWEQLWILSALQRIASMMNAEDIDAAPVLTTGPLAEAPAVEAPPVRRLAKRTRRSGRPSAA
jgi:DNA-binding MarR family transcriptional regulator